MTDTPLSIPDLIAQLGDNDPAVRKAAAKALGEAKAVEAIEPLMRMAQSDADGETQDLALQALSRIDDARVIPFLLSQLGNEDRGQSESAAKALANLAPFSVQPLIDTLENHQQLPAVRGDAAMALVNCVFSDRIDHPAAKTPAMIEHITDVLLKHLDDDEADVRESSAISLGRIGAKKAIPALIQRLQDPVAYVRWGAIDALGRLKGAQALDPLIACLNDLDVWNRSHAAEVLGWFNDPKPAPYLLLALQDSDTNVRAYAADSLGKLKYVPAVERLIACLDDPDEHVRWCAAMALGHIRDQRALEPLRKAFLKETDEGVSSWCVWALAQLGDETTFQPLIDYLKSRPKKRWRMAEALGDLGNPAAVEPLIEVWADSTSWQRRSIVDALKKLDTPRAVEAFTAMLGESDDPEIRKAAQTALDQLHRIESDSPDTRD